MFPYPFVSYRFTILTTLVDQSSLPRKKREWKESSSGSDQPTCWSNPTAQKSRESVQLGWIMDGSDVKTTMAIKREGLG